MEQSKNIDTLETYQPPSHNAPSTIFHLVHIIAVLRRSLVSVEHHHRHHVVVLTELFPDTLLDRSPGIVIELNVC